MILIPCSIQLPLTSWRSNFRAQMTIPVSAQTATIKKNSDGILRAPSSRPLTALFSAVNTPAAIRRKPVGMTYLSCIPRSATSFRATAIMNFQRTLPKPARKHSSAPTKKTQLRSFTPSMIAAIPKNNTGTASMIASCSVN